LLGNLLIIAVRFVISTQEIEAPVPAAEGLTASEKRELAWLWTTITGIFSGWNLYWLQHTRDSRATRPDKVFVVYNFWLYSVFAVLSNGGAYSFGETRSWLPIVSFFGMVHWEYLIFMVFYECHRLAGTAWDTLAPLLACSATMVALFWSLASSPEWWARRAVPHHQQHRE
jgi:hypothetical protein